MIFALLFAGMLLGTWFVETRRARFEPPEPLVKYGKPRVYTSTKAGYRPPRRPKHED